MATYTHGDIFSIPVANGKFVTGKIILDVRKQCLKTKMIDSDSPLAFFDGGLLIDIYKHVAVEPQVVDMDRLIAGIFIMNTAVKSGDWPIIGNNPVEPKNVEFPETLANVQGSLCFQRGEIVIPLAKQAFRFEALEIFPTMLRPVEIPLVCNYYLQSQKIIDGVGEEMLSDLSDCDLRFTDQRSIVYQALEEDEDLSYYDFAFRHGKDVARFY